MLANIVESFNRLESWLEKQNYEGIDHYDPWWRRKTIAKRRIPLADALFLKAYLKINPVKAHRFAKQLVNGQQFCWGYPFDWRSLVFIPADTPNAYVSAVCASALLDYAEMFPETGLEEKAKKTCHFLLSDLWHSNYFSYTPLDDMNVNNVNALCASLLTRCGWKTEGQHTINAVLADQNPDGSWNYFNKEYAKKKGLGYNKIDFYHTGYILEALRDLGTPNERGEQFWLQNFLAKNNGVLIPKHRVYQTYPTETWSCAEAIILLSKIGRNEEARSLAEWTAEKMQDKSGYFYFNYGNFNNDKTPYLRSQAWMLLSLSYLLNGE